MYYNRKTASTENEIEFQQKSLKFLYCTFLGRIILKLIVARPFISKLRGAYERSKFSAKDIKPFVKKYKIDVDESELDKYTCFNDFFTRHKEIKLGEHDPKVLLAIADSKLSYYKITNDLKLKIKNSVYSIEDITGDKSIAEHFRNGCCLVFRLTVDDYHRYHYVDSGKLLESKEIKGELHTVRPISENFNVFARNTRVVSLLDTENLGKAVQIEVGALMVGKIVNHGHTEFAKMQEKGYFEFGGSTVVLLLNKEIIFDDDIVKANTSGMETRVCAGERIGYIC